MGSATHRSSSTAGSDPGLLAHDEAGFHVLREQEHPLRDVLDRHPDALVQDPTTSGAVRRTMGLSPGTILDYCAGRGTKTRQLAAVHPEARIIATDVDEVRFDALVELAADSPRIDVVEPDEARAMVGQIDLLVLDVPCSNTGVLPRRPEARLRFSMPALETLVGMQRQIFADTIPCLAPAGHVLYSTCSLEPEENEQMPAWLSKWHGWDLVDETRVLPRGLPGDGPDRYCDGGYAAADEDALIDNRRGSGYPPPASLRAIHRPAHDCTMIELHALIQPDCIMHPLTADDPHGVIRELVQLLHDRNLIADAEETADAVWAREQQRSTGIGEGLAIPHGRCASLKRVVAAVGWAAAPIDFKALMTNRCN